MSTLMIKPTSLVVVLLVLFSGLVSSRPLLGRPQEPSWPGVEWTTSTPEQEGVDSTRILHLLREIRNSGLDVHSLLLVRNGRLITEVYWSPYHRETLHDVKSVSKSIMSALVGIALDRHELRGLDHRVSEFFPEYVPGPQKQRITLVDLLTMRTGLDWKEDAGPSPFNIANWKQVAMKDSPGGPFEYNTAMPHMMSAILTKVAGSRTKDFADRFLFRPLGIRRDVWKMGEDGYECGGSEVFLTPGDMARFGYLYLNGGLWNGQRIIPSRWVAESTSVKVKTATATGFYTGVDYGYWWWIPDKGYMAWGAGGQYILVRPDLHLVVVLTANSFDRINRYGEFLKPFLDEYLFPGITSGAPLGANPSANAELKAMTRDLEHPKRVSPRPMPAIAARVSGRTYLLEPNKPGFESFTLEFRDGRDCLWKYRLGGRTVELRVGLDGDYLVNPVAFSMGSRPEGETVACKGHWNDDHTFVVDHHIVGDPSKQVFELAFQEQGVTMRLATLGLNAEIKGRPEKQENDVPERRGDRPY